MHDITRLPLLDSPACAALCDVIDGMRLQWLDRQFEDIPWQHPGELDFDQPVSFTLPLRLPAAGGGLNTWPADWRHCHDSPLLIPELLVRSLECHRVAYTEGVLMVHSGHMLHQIAPAPDMCSGDRRITLQGHALPRRGVYQLYW